MHSKSIETLDVSLFNIKSYIREGLERMRVVDTGDIVDLEFGDIRTEPDGNEIVPIKVTRMANEQEVPQQANG
jgi:hypothetical protein